MPDTEDTRITPETGELYYVVNSLISNVQEATVEIASTATTSETVAGHTHEMSDVNGLLTSLSGKASVQHTHNVSDILELSTLLLKKSDVSHQECQYF